MIASILTNVLTNVDDGLRPYWHPVAAAADVTDEPRRVHLLGEPFVLVRLAGTVAAFPDRCPHRFARLSDGRVVDGHLECPYHGWRFDGDGRCALVPALGPDATLARSTAMAPPAVREQHGLVWIAPATPLAEPLAIPEWDGVDATGTPFTPIWLPTITARCGAAQFLDNFLDFAHFPFVHAGTFGAGEDARIADYEVARAEDGLRLVYEHVINHHEDPLVATGEHPLLQPRIMEYTYRIPFTARLRLEYPLTGAVNTIVAWAQPETAATTVLHTLLLRNDVPDPAAGAAFADYELAVLHEDLRILERLPDTTFPLDPTTQAHTRADRVTVELRRLLREAVSGSPPATVSVPTVSVPTVSAPTAAVAPTAVPLPTASLPAVPRPVVSLPVVPLIDLAPFRAGTNADRTQVAERIGAACRDVGFFAIIGHGVPHGVIDDLVAVSHAFFALPEDVKRASVPVPRHGNRGYNPLGGEALAYAMDDIAPPDLFESFTTGPIGRPADRYHTAPGARDFFIPNLFPAEPPGFEAAWNAYYRANEMLAADLMAAFALALGLPETYFAPFIDRHLTAQRTIRYPAIDHEPLPGQLRIAEHSDYGSLTILLTDTTPGLQIQGLDGGWIDVVSPPGAFLVNLGDLMADWTNGRWRSTRHRVLATALDRDRYSTTFFHHPNYDALIECLPSCLAPGEEPMHEPVTAGDHLYRKLTAQLVD